MLKVIAVLAFVLFTSGCATVVNDAAEPLKVDTMTGEGRLVPGAECEMTNDHGVVKVISGESAKVERSGDDLNVICKHPGHEDAIGRVVSRVNAGMFGNIILGGGIGAVVDHAKGTAYTYPSWIQLVFGQVLSFDHEDSKPGEPVTGKPVGAKKPAKP